MGFLDQLVRGAEFRSSTSGLARPANWLSDAFSSGKSAAGQRVTAEKAIGVSSVWAAVSLISETVGSLPLKVFKTVSDDERDIATSHRAYGMLHDRPNPLMPADRFWSTVAAHLLLWGNAFIEKRRTNVLVDELWLLDPRDTMVEWDSSRRTKRFVQDKNGRRRVWSQDEVLHIMGWSLDGLMGESVVSRCRQMFGTALARDEFEGEFYGNGAVLSGLVQHPETVGELGIKNLRESIGGIYAGSGKRHRVAVLEEGATWQTMSAPLGDLEFVASQQLTATQVATLFHLPPAYLGGSTGDSLTYATVESNQIQFAQLAIAPITNTIAKALSADLTIFPFNAWYPEFVLEGLMRGDHGARASYYQTMFGLVDEKGKRAITVDEIRSRENFKPAVVPPAPPVATDGVLTDADLAALTQPRPPVPG